MKICIVTHKLIKGDGQGRVNYEIASAAIRNGYQVTLIATQIDSKLQNHPLVEWVYIPVKIFPSVFLRNLAFSWQSTKWLKTYRKNLDIVVINGAINSFPADINIAHFVHSSWLQSPFHISKQRKNLYGFYQWFYTFLNSYWEKRSFAIAKLVVAVSKKVKDELIEIGVPSEKIQVIFNGVDLEEFSPGYVKRQKIVLPENVTLAMFAGDIRTNRKNLDTVLKALVELPNLHLAVLGNVQNSPYPKMAEDLGISQRVHFLGYRVDVAQIMQTVDMFVFPSRYEACTLVLLEAIASGLPVITAKITGGSEVITSECGILLNSTEDVSELSKALERLTSDRNLREQMGKAGRAIAEQHSWESKAERYLHLFEELIAS
ncbi:glycosyl transferase group 1 [Stanieria cyanosphaera PCC 7437]|uniref:Glycosyl transferase group 1 n=1 Tax=Stanieria cyanosphaera (strain ATCC 29371 / PCC 7437) TaxID=111780 RepID=K9XRR5_STAC7|nr:glycosyltransferase family 4 protein [Stanieria cyanosphaera]AFZ34372.1 glycosyl transferase group 1 [Stanieria cyanosphaera PCC 7437]